MDLRESDRYVREVIHRLAARHEPRSASWDEPNWGEPDAWVELVALMDTTGWSKTQSPTGTLFRWSSGSR
jgi:hypothetical protein